MKKKFNYYLIPILISLFITIIADVPCSYAKESNSPKANIQLIQLLNNINAMKANFTQIITNKSGSILQEQAGIMQLMKPNLLHWQVLTPDHLLIVSDGDKIWNYDIDLEQVTIKNLSEEIQNTNITNLLLDKADKLLEKFDVTSLNELHFILNLKSNNKTNESDYSDNLENIFIKAEIIFNQSKKIIMLKFYDQLEQETTINFYNFKNKVDRNIFNFKVPEGVDVIETKL